MSQNLLQQCPNASLVKQLLGMLYDSLLIAALLFLATAILLPFNQGEAVSGLFYNFYLLMVVFLFYVGFWGKSGQTLGMKVWKIRIITDYGTNPTWPISFLRLTAAVFPPLCFFALNYYFVLLENSRLVAAVMAGFFLLGYLNRLISPYTWHDRISQTRIIDVSGLQQ
jgi:uncharacterized RDD family membrane protein YckC